MCRKVQPSIFISKRKRLINLKCYTKDSFSFTSLFISLKSALFPLLSCSHSTLRNTTCTLYQSAHPQIRLQPNIPSPSVFKTNILSLLGRPYRSGWDTLQIFDSRHSSGMFFSEEKLQKAEMRWTLRHPAGWGPSPVPRATLGAGSPGAGDPRALLSPLLTSHEGSSRQQGRNGASQGALMPQPALVSAGKG